MTRLLDKLETRGLLRRIADPGDRRALHIVLTEEGQAIWSDIQHCGERVRARAMQGLDDGEREQLFRLLNQVLQNLTPPTANDD
jgi:DNA-binding MarR family transcriptional regulator